MLNKQIAKYIILAQIASDGGKDIYERELIGKWHRYWDDATVNEKVADSGYEYKSEYIRKAILRINALGPAKCGFNYWATTNGHTHIVYFSFKLDGERYQISFHDFSPFVKQVATKNKAVEHKMHWETKLPSRETAILLKKKLGLH